MEMLVINLFANNYVRDLLNELVSNSFQIIATAILIVINCFIILDISFLECL